MSCCFSISGFDLFRGDREELGASCVFSGADFNLHIWNLRVSEGATENEHRCKAVVHRPGITEKHN